MSFLCGLSLIYLTWIGVTSGAQIEMLSFSFCRTPLRCYVITE